MDTPVTRSLRERKKAQTRRTIQVQALRLFLERGYETTTVEEIAAAAGVSHMTFFRYFPTKEDVVIADDYDPLIAELIAARPGDEPAVDRVRHALQAGLELVYAADREALLVRTRLILRTPALRARLWEQQRTTERLIAQALAAGGDGDKGDLRRQIVAAACLAALNTAILAWSESDGAAELPDLVDETFTLLREELGSANG